MIRQRSFGGTSSPTSVFLGFLDVISCGFGAALILGLILSIIQPIQSTDSAAPTTYAYFEFALEPQSESSSRVILIPTITYIDPNGQIQNYSVKCSDAQPTAHVEPKPPFEVLTWGCSLDYGTLGRKSIGTSQQQTWSLLVLGLQANSKVNVQMIYADREDLSTYLPHSNQGLPALRLRRLRLPGNQLEELDVPFGYESKFNNY